jgi:uncharacterized protein (TIRG00374 family)
MAERPDPPAGCRADDAPRPAAHPAAAHPPAAHPSTHGGLGRVFSRLFLGALAGLLVYAAIVLWLDAGAIWAAVRRIESWRWAAALALTAAHYGLRFLRWQRYLALLGIQLPWRTSLRISLAGLSMSVTPGKLGEVLKSWLLRESTGVPVHESAPIVLAERVTDLAAIVLLGALAGAAGQSGLAPAFAIALVLVGVGVALVSSRRAERLLLRPLAWSRRLARVAVKLRGALASARVLFAPRQLLVPSLIGCAGWACEGLGFWILAEGVASGGIGPGDALCAYAAATLLGALAFVAPGGLGVTEGSLGTLARRSFQERLGLDLAAARSSAAALVLAARLCTLWFGVALGLAAAWSWRKLEQRQADRRRTGTASAPARSA